METKLEAERRDDNGKGVARKLRAAGRVPAVLLRARQETVPLSVDAREMFHVLHSAGGSNVLARPGRGRQADTWPCRVRSSATTSTTR